MYVYKKPVLHLSEVNGYVDGKYITIGDDILFHSEEELISFLTRYHHPVINFFGDKYILGNKYIDNQIFDANHINNDCNYIFWWDLPGQPFYDVRLLKPKIDKKYEERCRSVWAFHKFRWNAQGRVKHTRYTGRCKLRYAQRRRAAIGLLYDPEEEYRALVKPKDLYYDLWMNEDFFGDGKGSSGWKDNPGNKYRHQWEPRQKRKKVKPYD